MIDEQVITKVINDMIRDGHVMESGDYCHPDGIYRYKIKRIKKK